MNGRTKIELIVVCAEKRSGAFEENRPVIPKKFPIWRFSNSEGRECLKNLLGVNNCTNVEERNCEVRFVNCDDLHTYTIWRLARRWRIKLKTISLFYNAAEIRFALVRSCFPVSSRNERLEVRFPGRKWPIIDYLEYSKLPFLNGNS